MVLSYDYTTITAIKIGGGGKQMQLRRWLF